MKDPLHATGKGPVVNTHRQYTRYEEDGQMSEHFIRETYNYDPHKHINDIHQQLTDAMTEITYLKSYIKHIETERDSLAEQLRGQSA